MSTSTVTQSQPQPANGDGREKKSEVIEATARQGDSRGKNEARRLRVQGKIPAIVYGAKKETVAISLDPKQIMRILHSESGHNTIFDLQVDSERTKVMVVDSQYDPIKGNLLHIDLKRIAMDKAIRINVPIELHGEAEGVKQQGGILEQLLREVEIECLPADIPNQIDIDVSKLVFGEVIRVADLPHHEKFKFLTNENLGVAHIATVKEEVVATPDVAAEAAAAATPAEPEVIKKGKQEAEEGVAEVAEKKK